MSSVKLQWIALAVVGLLASPALAKEIPGPGPAANKEHVDMASVASNAVSVRARQNELASERNRKNGEAFLAENGTRKGVVSLENGLQYEVLKAGDGKIPASSDQVVCHYRGTLIDGTEFANTRTRTDPPVVTITKTMKGWREALQRMPVGSTWRIFVPPSLAYGERRISGLIGSNSTLIFEMELIRIHETAGESPEKTQTVAAGKNAPMAGAPVDIKVSFKLDPRLTKSIHMGEHWVTPETYMRVQDGNTLAFDVRVHGIDVNRIPVPVNPSWNIDDPRIATVFPHHGDAVEITVHRSGEALLQMVHDGLSKVLVIKAAPRDGILVAEISQARAATSHKEAGGAQP